MKLKKKDVAKEKKVAKGTIENDGRKKMEVSQKDAMEGTSKKNNDGSSNKNKEVRFFLDVSHFVAFFV